MFCILEDCNKEECHHCFPVKHCSYKHAFCKQNGCVREIHHKNRILVTGCGGFIGFHVCNTLLTQGFEVIGIDNFDPYYDVSIKRNNVDLLRAHKHFCFEEHDICSTDSIANWKPYKVIHLASMAGVRNSIQDPKKYIKVNIEGFIHIMEECVKHDVFHVVYASSSSVYGLNKTPFRENDVIGTCNSPYACSKMSMELFAKTYTQLYNISCIGLRFFTVYGPHGRPDMAPYKFMKAIMDGTPIPKYGDGTSSRDYTYISDIVEGILGACRNKTHRKCEVYNLGNSTPITLNSFIKTCEKVCGKEAIIDPKEDQLGDVPHTFACIEKAKRDLDYEPKVQIEDGLRELHAFISNFPPRKNHA